MLALGILNPPRRKGRKTKTKTKKRKTVKSRKRSLAAKRAWARRKRTKPKARKRRRATPASRKKVTKRRRTRTMTRKRKSPKRVAAGKKAARTRARRYGKSGTKRRRTRARKRRRNPVLTPAVNPRRRKRRKSYGKKRFSRSQRRFLKRNPRRRRTSRAQAKGFMGIMRKMVSTDNLIQGTITFAAIGGSWIIPNLLLKDRDRGWMGVGLTALAGGAESFLAFMLFGPKGGESALRGATIGTLLKGIATWRGLPTPMYIFKAKDQITSAEMAAATGVSGYGEGYSMDPESLIAAESLGQIPGSQMEGVDNGMGAFLDMSEPEGMGDFLMTQNGSNF